MSAATWAPALAAWMTVGLVTSGVLAAHAHRCLHWLARGAFATRAVWSVALLATIGLSVTQPMRQAEPTPTNGRAWSAVTLVAAANAPRVPTVWERIDHTARDAATGAQQSVRSMATASAGTVRGWPVIAQWALLLLCPLASLGMLALGAWSYRTQRLALRTAQVMSIDATTVHVSPSFGPAVFGTRDPRVVIPRWMLERSADEIRLVLQHEQAHIAAGDPLLLLSGCLALALLPWNPFAWFMLSRLRLAIELDCDARVLAAGASTRRYGALLIDLSAASAPLPALTGAPAFFPPRFPSRTENPQHDHSFRLVPYVTPTVRRGSRHVGSARRVRHRIAHQRRNGGDGRGGRSAAPRTPLCYGSGYRIRGRRQGVDRDLGSVDCGGAHRAH
ncbi:M56 family metallopeptidase [Gemmatimonas sp.]|uniref:M56 family metallopeptidase n=1 Tax=Gemmatimonas sp. TaxID=1962908 RepID=UPI003DA52704